MVLVKILVFCTIFEGVSHSFSSMTPPLFLKYLTTEESNILMNLKILKKWFLTSDLFLMILSKLNPQKEAYREFFKLNHSLILFKTPSKLGEIYPITPQNPSIATIKLKSIKKSSLLISFRYIILTAKST